MKAVPFISGRPQRRQFQRRARISLQGGLFQKEAGTPTGETKPPALLAPAASWTRNGQPIFSKAVGQSSKRQPGLINKRKSRAGAYLQLQRPCAGLFMPSGQRTDAAQNRQVRSAKPGP